MEMKITKSEMCYDNIDKLPKCIHEYKKHHRFIMNLVVSVLHIVFVEAVAYMIN